MWMKFNFINQCQRASLCASCGRSLSSSRARSWVAQKDALEARKLAFTVYTVYKEALCSQHDRERRSVSLVTVKLIAQFARLICPDKNGETATLSLLDYDARFIPFYNFTHIRILCMYQVNKWYDSFISQKVQSVNSFANTASPAETPRLNILE